MSQLTDTLLDAAGALRFTARAHPAFSDRYNLWMSRAEAVEEAGRLMTGGAEAIARERRRQVEEEGWTPEHDDSHLDGALATVGALYAMPRREVIIHLGDGLSVGVDLLARLWPKYWRRAHWKPTPGERIRELEKAGALIAAEIDRLRRGRKGQVEIHLRRDEQGLDERVKP